jgi:hypothetical protein
MLFQFVSGVTHFLYIHVPLVPHLRVFFSVYVYHDRTSIPIKWTYFNYHIWHRNTFFLYANSMITGNNKQLILPPKVNHSSLYLSNDWQQCSISKQILYDILPWLNRFSIGLVIHRYIIYGICIYMIFSP